MSKIIRNKIEGSFSRLGRYIYRNRFKSLLVALLCIGTLVGQFHKITIDTSPEALLHKNDPARLTFNAFQEQFGRGQFITIALNPPEVFDRKFLSTLASFHQELEDEVPYLKEVTSLINVRYTRGEGDILIVEDLLSDLDEDDFDPDALKKKVLGYPLYEDSIISRDGKVTAVIIEASALVESGQQTEDVFDVFDDLVEQKDETPTKTYFSEKENRQFVEAVIGVVERYRDSGFHIYIAGSPFVLDVYNEAMSRDIILVILISLVTVALFLAIFFQRVSGVVLPEIVMIFALFSTAGLMGFFNVPFKLTTVVLPAFLLAVSVGDAVHVLAIFYRRFQEGDSREDAIAYAMGHSGLAVVLTSLTTAAGLLSFSFADLTAMADVGIFGAAGVMFALFYTIVLLPALISFMPLKRKPQGQERKKSVVMDRVLLSFANLAIKHPVKILFAGVFLFGLSTYFIFQLRYSHDIINWLNKKETVRRDVPLIDDLLKGTITIEVVADTSKEGGIFDPEFLRQLDLFTSKAKKYKSRHVRVGKVLSVNDIFKEVSKALHENDPDWYILPKDRETAAQQFLLFEESGYEDLDMVIDGARSKTRITIKTNWCDAVYFRDFIAYVRSEAESHLLGKAEITVTGIAVLMSRSIPAALKSMAVSYALAVTIITIMMIFLAGDIKTGLLCMGSNLLPIFIVMGIMGALKIPIDMSTIMIGSIAIGIVVDDTVHFLYNFRKYYEKSSDAHFAVKETMLGTGRALLMTTLILTCGFFALSSASLSLLVVFGLLTGLTIILALLADFILAPAILVLVSRKPNNNEMEG